MMVDQTTRRVFLFHQMNYFCSISSTGLTTGSKGDLLEKACVTVACTRNLMFYSCCSISFKMNT